MSTMTLVKNEVALFAAGSSNAAGADQQATCDLRTAQGGFLGIKMLNGATGPTARCQCIVYAHSGEGATPAADVSNSSAWIEIYRVQGSTSNNALVAAGIDISPGVAHLMVRFVSNTGQAVSVQATLSKITSIVSA